MGWNKPNAEARWPVVAVRLPFAERDALKRLAREWKCSQSYVMRYGISLAAREYGLSMRDGKKKCYRFVDDVIDGQIRLSLEYESSLPAESDCDVIEFYDDDSDYVDDGEDDPEDPADADRPDLAPYDCA